jgi:hypothetical protein
MVEELEQNLLNHLPTLGLEPTGFDSYGKWLFDYSTQILDLLRT